jgi:phosphomannomutase
MQEGEEKYGSAVSWEVNGGFVLGTPVKLDGKTLEALPTRDALLPILCALLAAITDESSVSELFAKLPRRYTGGGLMDDVPMEKIKAFKKLCSDDSSATNFAKELFDQDDLGSVTSVDLTDGMRLLFSSNDVVHLRPSGNAPQLRVYTNTSSQERADQLADNVIRTGPETILPKL